MNYRIERQEAVESDLVSISDFLLRSFEAFGHSTEEAEAMVAERLEGFLHALQGLAKAPYRGPLRPEMGSGIRNVTMDRFIVYFDVNEDMRVVRILAIFYGGQDHMRRMLARMLR